MGGEVGCNHPDLKMSTVFALAQRNLNVYSEDISMAPTWPLRRLNTHISANISFQKKCYFRVVPARAREGGYGKNVPIIATSELKIPGN